jgi:hypothetical protein
VGGNLGGVVPLATSTVSSKASEIYNALADMFVAVGSLNTAREASTAVVLPNNKILVVGGSQCYATFVNKTNTIAASPTGATEVGNTVTITTTALNGFTAGDPVKIAGVGVAGYNGTFTIATIVSTTKFTYTDATAGLAASGGGTATINPGPACGASVASGFQCDALQTSELYDETTSTFTIAGAGSGHLMTTERSGATATLMSNGKVLISGGSAGSGAMGTFLALTAPPVGCGPSGQQAQNSAEIYDPVADSFTATTPIPGCALGTAPPACTTGLPANCPITATIPIAASPTGATEAGNTVTITTTVPHGFSAGQSVVVAGVTVVGYNGSFTILAAPAPTATTFAYTDAVAGLAASGGGAATSSQGFRQCGVVDSVAALLDDTSVLVTGGDYLAFLGQSSPQAFIYVPGTATWAQTAPMNVARELPGIVKMPSGEVLIAGGVTSAAAACIGSGTPPGSTPAAFTSNFSAETYDPVAHTWTLTPGSSATPGAAGGMSVARVATVERFLVGPDAGLAIAAAGVNARTTDGAGTDPFPTCEPVTNIAQTTQSATDLFDETTDLFTATGALNQDRAAYASAILNSGAHSGNLAVYGGDCGNGTLASWVIGTAAAGTNCAGGVGTGLTDYYEFFNPATGLWTVGAAATPATPTAGSAYTLLP